MADATQSVRFIGELRPPTRHAECAANLREKYERLQRMCLCVSRLISQALVICLIAWSQKCSALGSKRSSGCRPTMFFPSFRTTAASTSWVVFSSICLPAREWTAFRGSEAIRISLLIARSLTFSELSLRPSGGSEKSARRQRVPPVSERQA